MKEREPNIEDYGITIEEYRQWKKAIEDKEKSKKKNSIIKKIIRSLLIGVLFSFLVFIVEGVFAIHLVRNVGQLLGYCIVFVIMGVMAFVLEERKIKKQFNKTIQVFGDRKLKMIEKYHKDSISYIEKRDEKNSNINICLANIEFIKNNYFFDYDTKKLKELVQMINKNYKAVENKIYDFTYEKTLIKCVGVGDFICKIDVEELKEYILNTSYENIIVYSLIDIDEDILTSVIPIEYVDKIRIKNLLLAQQKNILNVITNHNSNSKN